ncbi:hypothetical protein ACLB1G_03030 [Oxalobacteraceae bacterium A2-2]
MDRQRTLLQITQRMHAALAADDWQALAAINTMMASALPQMAAAGAWSPAERAALRNLRETHEQARTRCAAVAAELESRLRGMRDNKEGWMAYALDNEFADTGSHV